MVDHFSYKIAIIEDLLDSLEKIPKEEQYRQILKKLKENHEISEKNREKLNKIYEKVSAKGNFLKYEFLIFFCYWVSYKEALYQIRSKERMYWTALLDLAKCTETFKSFSQEVLDRYKNIYLAMDKLINEL